jgi:hypothetical protein
VPCFVLQGEGYAQGRDAAVVAFGIFCRYGAAMRGLGLLAIGAVLAAAIALPLPTPAAERHKPEAAAATETLGSAGPWSAYMSHDATGRVCFLAGQPQHSDGGMSGRRQPMAMVTHRPAEHIFNVVSFIEGYGLKPSSVVALVIGDRKFSLFVRGDSAWAPTSELDRAITTALSRGSSAVVAGEAANGSRTTDVYALTGFAKALALIDNGCGLTAEQSVLAAAVVHAPARPHEERKAALHKREPAHRPVHRAATHKKPVHKKPVHKPTAHPENPSGSPAQMAPHPSG